MTYEEVKKLSDEWDIRHDQNKKIISAEVEAEIQEFSLKGDTLAVPALEFVKNSYWYEECGRLLSAVECLEADAYEGNLTSQEVKFVQRVSAAVERAWEKSGFEREFPHKDELRKFELDECSRLREEEKKKASNTSGGDWDEYYERQDWNTE